jgi:hypothetical protein
VALALLRPGAVAEPARLRAARSTFAGGVQTERPP